MQVELNVDNSIVIYGSFSELPNSTNDFEGLMQYGYGFDSEERNILSLNAKFDDQDSISGTLLVESNTVTVNDTVVLARWWRNQICLYGKNRQSNHFFWSSIE